VNSQKKHSSVDQNFLRKNKEVGWLERWTEFAVMTYECLLLRVKNQMEDRSHANSLFVSASKDSD
jgi:hypothetical protein